MDKIIIPIDIVEAEFDIEVKKNKTSLGLDTATKTGWCIAKANTKNIEFSVGHFAIDLKRIKEKKDKNRLRYEAVYTNLSRLMKKDYITVIENVYHGVSAQVTIILSRIGGIAYAVARAKGVPQDKIEWYTASEARKNIGIKGNAKKQEILETVNYLLDMDLKCDDEADAVVLAINGLIKE